jgi:hypothetical protein
MWRSHPVVGCLLWTATQALAFIEERRFLAPERRAATVPLMVVLPATIPYLQYRLRTVLSEAREDEWIAGVTLRVRRLRPGRRVRHR